MKTALDLVAAAKARIEELCDKLLANPVIEDFEVTEIK